MKTQVKLAGCLSLLIAATLTGCAQLRAQLNDANLNESREQVARVDQHSSYPAISRESFEHVHLIELVDPRGEAQHQYPTFWKENTAIGVKYDLVLAWFRESPTDKDVKRLQRDAIQDRILAVSTSRCNVFKTYLRRQQTDVNFWLGTASTVSGVLGAVLQGATASRNLAGAAGLFSGVQAEFNQSYYSNLAAHVIVQGVELRQARLTQELIERRLDRTVDQYSLEAAIKDALFIDGNCSAVAGLIEAQESIKQVENPGLQMASRAMVGAMALRTIADNKLTDLQQSGALEKLLKLTTTGIPPLMVTSTKASPDIALNASLANARDTALRVANTIRSEADALAFAFTQKANATGKADPTTITADTVAATFVKAAGELLADSQPPKKALSRCLVWLQGFATASASASAATLLAANDEPERITKQLALDQAAARTLAATRRVALVGEGYQAAIKSTAQAWQLALMQAKPFGTFDPTQQPKPVVDDARLSSLCTF